MQFIPIGIAILLTAILFISLRSAYRKMLERLGKYGIAVINMHNRLFQNISIFDKFNDIAYNLILKTVVFILVDLIVIFSDSLIITYLYILSVLNSWYIHYQRYKTPEREDIHPTIQRYIFKAYITMPIFQTLLYLLVYVSFYFNTDAYTSPTLVLILSLIVAALIIGSIVLLVRNFKAKKEADNISSNDSSDTPSLFETSASNKKVKNDASKKATKKLGMKWFFFFCKVRPVLACLAAITTIFDFLIYSDTYVDNWWLMLSFILSISILILNIIVMIKSDGDYVKFVRFVKFFLLFDAFTFAYQMAIQDYIRTEFDIASAFGMFAIALVVEFLVWYLPNIKYFKKRIDIKMNEEEDDDESNNESASVVITPTPVPSTQNTSGQVIKCRKCGYESKSLFNACPECGSYAKDYVQIQEESTETKSRICRKCGEELLPDSVYCRKCGTKFAAKTQCRKCGEEIPPDSIYCHKCGTKNSSKTNFLKKLKKKLNKKTLIISIVTCVSLLAVAGIGTYIYIDNTTCYVYNCFNTCSGKYCYLHGCAASECDRIREDSSRYCYEHKCARYDCTNGKTADSNYCSFHTNSNEIKDTDYYIEDETTKQSTIEDTCRSVGCDNVVGMFDDYCSEHSCIEPYCNFEKELGSNYCFSHSCYKTGCENRRSNSGHYCYEHTCIEPYCNNQKSTFSDYYCLLHDD